MKIRILSLITVLSFITSGCSNNSAFFCNVFYDNNNCIESTFIEQSSDNIYINDQLDEEKNCTEEDKCRNSINKNLLVNFQNTFYSTKEHSWFFKPNNKGLPPEEPGEIKTLLNETSGYYIGNTEQKELYLTFDEGYENGYTNDILDTLKKHQVKAAFFVVEHYIKSNPEIIKRMVDEGHLVCNHSAHHPSMAKVTDLEKFKKELGEVDELFKEITGKEMPKYFRPPMGRFSELSMHYTKDLNYKTVFWSLAYYDWDPKKQPNAADAKKLLLKRTHNGAIVLLHAVSKTNRDILDDLLTSWKSDGYTIKSLDQLQ
jgi:peptidoglycan-N-acetylmuramic acid deacetylase